MVSMSSRGTLLPKKARTECREVIARSTTAEETVSVMFAKTFDSVSRYFAAEALVATEADSALLPLMPA